MYVSVESVVISIGPMVWFYRLVLSFGCNAHYILITIPPNI